MIKILVLAIGRNENLHITNNVRDAKMTRIEKISYVPSVALTLFHYEFSGYKQKLPQ